MYFVFHLLIHHIWLRNVNPCEKMKMSPGIVITSSNRLPFNLLLQKVIENYFIS